MAVSQRVAVFTGFFVTALGCVVPSADGQARPQLVPGIPQIDSMASAEFARDSLASITFGIVRGDSLVWTRSFGYADVLKKRQANRNTVYRIGSVTKTFTGVMLLQLLERGKLSLADSASKFFPALGRMAGRTARSGPITVQQLATMTSGMPTEPTSEQFITGHDWLASLRSAIATTSLAHEPGTAFAYSNLGYAALAAVLSRAAGISYVEWQQAQILRPLALTHTWFDWDPAMTADLAVGYDISTGGVLDTAQSATDRVHGRGYKVPVGGMFTTVGDLARFLSLELGHASESIVSHATLDWAFGGVVASSAEWEFGYGLGFMVQKRGDFPWLGHSGGVPGYTAMMYYDRDHDLGVIALRNATGGKARLGWVAPEMLKTLVLAKIAAERGSR
jgi:CubicO group peptidase (beta-lactamase class C family)